MLDGGAGADVLDGTGGTSFAAYWDSAAGVTVNLLNTALNTGDALGDTTINLHNVQGSNFADAITGDNAGGSLYGLVGADVITGGTGNDTLTGGAGADSLTGGGGLNTFNYVFASEGGDVITDFSGAGGDKFAINHVGFGGGLAAGALPASAFVAGTAATLAQGQFLWDSAAHTLSWDPDGTGSASAVLIATLSNGATLGAANIRVY